MCQSLVDTGQGCPQVVQIVLSPDATSLSVSECSCSCIRFKANDSPRSHSRCVALSQSKKQRYTEARASGAVSPSNWGPSGLCEPAMWVCGEGAQPHLYIAYPWCSNSPGKGFLNLDFFLFLILEATIVAPTPGKFPAFPIPLPILAP